MLTPPRLIHVQVKTIEKLTEQGNDGDSEKEDEKDMEMGRNGKDMTKEEKQRQENGGEQLKESGNLELEKRKPPDRKGSGRKEK